MVCGLFSVIQGIQPVNEAFDSQNIALVHRRLDGSGRGVSVIDAGGRCYWRLMCLISHLPHF